jgi:putative transposase
MARPLRVEYPGALWHVMNRGVERRNIFADDGDRHYFLHLLEQVIQDYGWQLAAYVLMSNHYHLLFFTPERNLSRGMKDLDGDYAASFNRRHERVGHLFQGRFKSHLVDSYTYLLEVARYIVLNPVRAGMVDHVAAWPWSSYRPTAGLGACPTWLDVFSILDGFDSSGPRAATNMYREYVDAGVGNGSSPWEHLVAQAFLGSADFLQSIEERIRAKATSEEHPREQRAFRALTLDGVQDSVESLYLAGAELRSVFALLADRHTNATRAEIGRRLGMTGQGVGRLIHRSAVRIEADRDFARLVCNAETAALGGQVETRNRATSQPTP